MGLSPPWRRLASARLARSGCGGGKECGAAHEAASGHQERGGHLKLSRKARAAGRAEILWYIQMGCDRQDNS